jgi:NADPH-dependent glutamate synthase beta subunit-like oxidoreductase/NAD-dependent dihydropyrimidine dehydrogenase PreA subunit
MGIQVALITSEASLDLDSKEHPAAPSHESLHVWPLLLRVASHPRIELFTNCHINSIAGEKGKFVVKALKKPRYVKEELCTGCGKCEDECPVRVQSSVNGYKIVHGAIHSPIQGIKTVPSAYCIDKEGISPCRGSCPLGINVQGYIALLGKGKIDEALDLINDTAPMSGILGRLCTHPCETKCARGKVDSPVFIQSLHRYAADNAGEIIYKRKASAGFQKEKIAIIGSGPAGLTAAWELARRGYKPTIFESHAEVGGMMAMGIPRFRLPREVREKEINAIKALGIEIKTGVTVGGIIGYTDLIDRGYAAFFLAIGAHQNNKLNVPGEDLNGVVDCVSLLFSLNIKVGATVGSNVVVIGGGNSSVDSARSARRAGNSDVRILCVTDKMTAIKEEVDEAQKEGIAINYNVSVVEIIGENNNVTGLRCQRVKNVTFDADGKINMEYVPESEFVIKADCVVIAIGQKPDSRILNIKDLKISRNAAIEVDPLTLATNVPGIFAGGDAVTGSNNVVSAVASGLRAAESIDRYLKGYDLRSNRIMEAPEPVEVNIENRKVTPYKRSQMPVLAFLERKDNYEETNLGLSEEAAKQEASRCLNCAACCECLECERACELKAILHQDASELMEFESESIINFNSISRNVSGSNNKGILNVDTNNDGNMTGKLALASAVALTTGIELKNKEEKNINLAVSPTVSQNEIRGQDLLNRTTVFLCRCGESISSVVNFKKIKQSIAGIPGLYSVHEITQSCTEEGAQEIKSVIEQEKVNHAVLAACRCCNLEQICFSCTDRRVMCQNTLLFDMPENVNIEFTNIREQCAWIHKDDPSGATDKAIGLITTGIARAQNPVPAIYEPRTVNTNILVIGTGVASLEAVRNLAIQGYPVVFIADIPGLDTQKLGKQINAYQEKMNQLVAELIEQGVSISPWPQFMEINGVPGEYEALVKYGSRNKHFKAGVVILDLFNGTQESLSILAESNLINRVISRQHRFNRVSSLDAAIAHSFTVRETAGIFNIVFQGTPTVEEQIIMGKAAAARASGYLNRGSLKPRSSSVVIDARFCRGCGDCVNICSYIEIKTNSKGALYAYVDPALCFGCGACTSICPTGAITQPLQSEKGITAALKSLLKKTENVSEL